MTDLDALLGRAEDIMRQAIRAGADQGEAYLQAGASVSVDVEDGAVAAGEAVESKGGAVRIIKDGRVGFAYFTDPDKATGAIEEALRLSRLAPAKGYTLPSGAGLPTLPSRWDDGLAGLDPATPLQAVQDLVAACTQGCPDARVTGGSAGSTWGMEAIASSEGVAAADRATRLEVGASLTLQDGGSAISAWDHDAVHTGALDAAATGARVARTIASLQRPRDAVGGAQDVILLSDAAIDLVAGLVGSAVDGDTAMRGKSVWSDALDTEVAAAGISLHDDPLHGGLGSTPMDGEGLPARRQAILEGGVLRRFLFDSWTANQHGEKTTCNAVRSGHKDPPTTAPHHMVLEHRNTEDFDALVGGVDSGCLVESVLGAHTANATTGDFSVTAPNIWRIESGEVVGASREVAIGGNLPRWLRRLDAVSDRPVVRDGAAMPAIRFRDVQVSA